MTKLIAVIPFAVLVVGCSRQDVASQSAAAIGVSTVRVAEAATSLTIDGLDAAGATVGHLVLTRGVVSSEGLTGMGRTMNVEVRGKSAEHVDVTTSAVTLPPITPGGEGDLDLFLRDVRVSGPLAAWGVTFGPIVPPSASASTERAYFGGCHHGFQPTCGEVSCAGTLSDDFENVCCGSISSMVHRQCASSSPCGPIGSNGCTNCWSVGYGSTCHVWLDGAGTDGVAYSVDETGPNCLSDTDCANLDPNGYCDSDLHTCNTSP